jgi:hypothetical protein
MLIFFSEATATVKKKVELCTKNSGSSAATNVVL